MARRIPFLNKRSVSEVKALEQDADSHFALQTLRRAVFLGMNATELLPGRPRQGIVSSSPVRATYGDPFENTQKLKPELDTEKCGFFICKRYPFHLKKKKKELLKVILKSENG